jgi:hypothetical protein
LREHAAAQCSGMEDVLCRLRGIESAVESQRLSRGAARGLRFQTERNLA